MSLALPGATGPRPPFQLRVPGDMVTGRVLVRAEVADATVASVRWTVDDWSRVTPPPFELSFDSGPVPYERLVLAVALDRDRRPVYRGEALLNPGGRGLALAFETPAAGQAVSGPVEVEVRVTVPPDDEPATVSVDPGDGPVPLAPAGGGLYRGTVPVPRSQAVLLGSLTTRRGRRVERSLLVGSIGVVASAEAHVVEQLVSVTRRGKPVEGLEARDFTVTEGAVPREVRAAELVRDVPLAVGLAVDVSASILHQEAAKKAAADDLLGRCLREGDSAFVLAFGPTVRRVVDWTRSRERVREAVRALETYDVPGTSLLDALLEALYLFQGQQGARALVVVTDGFDVGSEAAEEAVLAYGRQAGVPVYVIALRSLVNVVSASSPDAGSLADVPPNLDLLDRLARATGGRTFRVEEAPSVSRAFGEIERDLRTQYLVSFASGARRTGTFHPVEVRVSRGKVRTSPGFFH